MATRSTTATKKAAPAKTTTTGSKSRAKAPVEEVLVDVPVVVTEAARNSAGTADTPAPKAEVKPVGLPSKKFGKLNLGKLDWTTDPTTEKAAWDLVKLPVGDYLMSIGVSRDGHYSTDWMVATDVQRAVLKINEKSYKHRMMRHVAQGGPVPPVICAVRGDNISPLDGLQRSDVFTQVAQGLAMLKADADAELPEVFKLAIKKAREMGHKVTDLDSFLSGKIGVMVYRDLASDEERRYFGSWNLDLQKVNPKQLAELRLESTRELLDAIGIKTETVKEKDTAGSLIRKSRKDELGNDAKPESWVRSLASVQMCLYAYLTGMWATDKNLVLEEDALAKMQERLGELPEGVFESDFGWFYLKLLPALHRHYDGSETAGGKQVASESETMLVPALAALGWARQELDGAEVEVWKKTMLELLELEDVSDPMGLFKGSKSWGAQVVSGELKGSAGQKARKLTFHGWKYAISKGMPVDWVKAHREACNAS